MKTEVNRGIRFVDRSGRYRRAVRGAGYEARAVVAALVLAAGIVAAGFVAGYAAGPVVYGQGMPGLMTDQFMPYVGK